MSILFLKHHYPHTNSKDKIKTEPEPEPEGHGAFLSPSQAFCVLAVSTWGTSE